jgi:hypothetical protein
MTNELDIQAVDAVLRGSAAEYRTVLRKLSDAQRTALADACHVLLAELERADLEGMDPSRWFAPAAAEAARGHRAGSAGAMDAVSAR